MIKGDILKLRSQKGREVYIKVLELKKYQTPVGEKTFVKYHVIDLDFERDDIYEDSLNFVQETYFMLDDEEQEKVQNQFFDTNDNKLKGGQE